MDFQAIEARFVSGLQNEEAFLEKWEKNLPDLLKAYKSGKKKDFRKMLLNILKSNPEISKALEKLSAAEQALLDAWEVVQDIIDGGKEIVDGIEAAIETAMSPVDEADGKKMKMLKNEKFKNWGRTVENKPQYTFFPRTKKGLCNLVKWCISKNERVRVSGYRHTWSDLYSQDGAVLVSMLPLYVVETIPAPHPPMDPSSELQGIQMVPPLPGFEHEKWCRIGAATTNEQFRSWCLDPKGGNFNVTLPLNVIMVEITLGGSNGPICHGAGITNRTLSDLVREIEFVNAKGELQTVTDPDLLKAASGCFGLLGVVTSVTLSLDAMSAAMMKPVKVPVGSAIPIPAGYPVPPGLDIQPLTPAQYQAAWQDFSDRALNDYYSEWFWFMFQKKCWVNTWKKNPDVTGAIDYPSPADTEIQEMEEALAQLMNETIMKLLPPRWQALILATSAMLFLPDGQSVKAWLIDALHFRRGIQNMRVLDMEFEIPFPADAADAFKPDLTVAQQAWWDAISAALADPNVPMKLVLEMRIMGGSDVLMAPQHGNNLGTCSIEILTILTTPADQWLAFKQTVADAWDKFTSNGQKLNVRPHWAKEWGGLKMRNMSIEDYLKNVAYKDVIPQFKQRLTAVASAGGYTMQDMKTLFSNPRLDYVLQGLWS